MILFDIYDTILFLLHLVKTRASWYKTEKYGVFAKIYVKFVTAALWGTDGILPEEYIVGKSM